MVSVFMHKLLKILYKYRVVIIILSLVVLALMATLFIYNGRYTYFITAKFSESGPLYKNMPVYYKGYNIGYTQSITPTADYKYTLAKIVLYPKNPKLPDNITAKVKNHNVRKEYVDLISVDEPSTTFLKNNSVIDGEPAFDLESFLSDIANSGLVIPLLQTFSETLVSIGHTSDGVREFFSDSRAMLNDNRVNLKQSTQNLASTTKSLKKLTTRFNTSITDEKLNSATSNVGKSSENILAASEGIKNITVSVDCATRNLDKTIQKIDATVSKANDVAANARDITSGFCQIMKKRFAGLRIIFGKPLNNGACSKNCSR